MANATALGYQHPDYAASLSDFGTPRELPACRGWILERPIQGFPWRDAMGCYPIFTCGEWSALYEDVCRLQSDLVTLALVTDPFGNYKLADLERSFNYLLPYKDHFVVDLSRNPESFVSSHHRRNIRRALGQVQVQISTRPLALLDDWINLYDILVDRHQIKGIANFSRQSFARQLQVPGITAFCALQGQQIVGITLWYLGDAVAYYHLGAYSTAGYKLGASFALFWQAISFFKDMVPWLSLGAGAGATARAESGLSRFKRGWATGTRTAYFCGHVFNNQRYQEIVSTRSAGSYDYFPAYRYGEFA